LHELAGRVDHEPFLQTPWLDELQWDEIGEYGGLTGDEMGEETCMSTSMLLVQEMRGSLPNSHLTHLTEAGY